ncbi:BACON domain-containing protein [Sphingobacterium bovistauri]|uniref:BACON domain-containing protein n=1 Tax=Sphingobacterium bovistauri TaxID=2781959 RepID=A0ABS7Z801_9SPHI|nr:BACON domain-containing protein [Sphingobacterium bovistauri]MCA5006275.1 hypothetical protein [Sphingobacterium bovistauri]
MKRQISILISTILLFIVSTSCQKDGDQSILSLDVETLQIPNEGGVFEIKVNSNQPSKAVITYDNELYKNWILMLPSVLKADGILELRIDPYHFIDADRKATVTITAGDQTKTVNISQVARDGLIIDQNIITTTESSKTFIVNVQSREPWTATVGADASSWCQIDDGASNGTADFSIRLTAMNTGTVRKATITVKSSTKTEIIELQQGYGVEIGNLVWAHYNVGDPNTFASSIDNRGLLYQFDSKIGYPNSSPNEDPKTPIGYVTGAFASGPEWYPNNDPSPLGWRIPSEAEILALVNKGYTWLTPEQSGFSIPGVILGIPKSEALKVTPTNTRGGIFLPQSGYRERDNGHQYNWWDATMTSSSRPGHNWDRPVFWFNYESLGGSYTNGNATAYPVRCIAK